MPHGDHVLANVRGKVGFQRIEWFNGGIFDDDSALPLTRKDIEAALSAANRSWSNIDPSIMGTLFERGLDPGKRSQLGAHYTDPDKIMLIVNPVIVEPLTREWEEKHAAIEAKIEQSRKAKSPAARTRAFDCQPARTAGATPEEIRGFQRSFNTAFKASIAVDGAVGDETRGAYFDLYQDELQQGAGGKQALATLRGHLRWVDPAHKVVALGERVPRENPEQDGLRSQRNRRVELMFFAPPRLPVPSAPDVGAQIYRRKLFTFAALDRDALADAAGPAVTTPGPMQIVAADPPEPGIGDASTPAVTDMPHAGRRDPTDAWAFLEPFDAHMPAKSTERPSRPNTSRPAPSTPPQPPPPVPPGPVA